MSASHTWYLDTERKIGIEPALGFSFTVCVEGMTNAEQRIRRLFYHTFTTAFKTIFTKNSTDSGRPN